MKNERLTIRIEADKKAELQRYANQRNLTMSQLITDAIKNLQCSKKT